MGLLRNRLIVALVASLVVGAALLVNGAAFPALASPGDDWPMLMHDPSHSGHTSSTLDISDGLQLQWKFSFGERVEVEVQPVVVDGKVYVGVMNGKMYCVDVATGQETWVYRAGGPIPHTAAVVQGRVFFGSLDGKVYAWMLPAGLRTGSMPPTDPSIPLPRS